MVNYYLTEMNILKLENILLQFIRKQQLKQLLINGVTIKVISMMYNKGIDYYYSDLLASSLDVPIKYVDNIYLYNQSKFYKDSLPKLLESIKDNTVKPEEAEKLEEDVNKVLATKKKIHTKKI